MTAEPFQFDDQQIEAGRLLFAGQCDFIAAAQNLPALPPVSYTHLTLPTKA